jgi:phosphohistidine phosphatase
MLTLYLLRHAKSDWSDPTLPDSMRPLSKRGRHDARLLASFFQSTPIRPKLVLCSTARRTRQTLEPLIEALGNPTVKVEEDLYAASAEALLDRLHAVPARFDSVMLIGHNPGLQELALQLTMPGKKRAALEAKFPTGALATINAAKAPWTKLARRSARLTAYVTPRHLANESAPGGGRNRR